MRVHHLNAGTMRPLGSPERLVCHVLLIETPDRLVLVDSGFGTRDADEHRTRLGSTQAVLRPVYDPAETVVAQIAALGHDVRDVRDVVLTHFDADHVGGLVDLPWATVHLSVAEHEAAHAPRTFLERSRYLPGTRSHGPLLAPVVPGAGAAWRGFAAARPLPGSDDRVVLVAMPGHTRGHCAVAVDLGERWLVHAGDTFYHRGQVGDPDRTPVMIRAMGRFSTHDAAAITASRRRLAELAAGSQDDVLVVNAHDPVLLERARAWTPARG